MQKRHFLYATSVLGIAGLISKLLGAIFRIPLEHIIGPQGMAYFQVAYPIYAIMMVICTVGLPVAVSNLVSIRAAKREWQGAHTVFLWASISFVVVGAIVSLLLWLLSDQIAVMTGIPEAAIVLKWMSPLVFLCLSISGLRGYFQGLYTVTPTAISQIIEQVVKLALGLIFAKSWLGQGDYAKAAAGAVLGVVIGEILALAFMVAVYFVSIPRLNPKESQQRVRLKSPLRLITRVWRKGMLVTIGAAFVPLCILIDSSMSVKLLLKSGVEQLEAVSLFGIFSGMVGPLSILPSAIIIGIALYAVPSISRLLLAKRFGALRNTAQNAVRITFVFSLGCAVGLFVLAKPILMLLFSNLTPEEIETGTKLLQMMSVGSLFAALAQTSTAILHGMNKDSLTCVNVIFALLIKIVLLNILVPMESVGVMGIAFSNVMCFGVLALMSTGFVIEFAQFGVKWWRYIPKMVVAGVAMGAAVFLVYYYLFQKWFGIRLGAILAMVLGVALYMFFCLMLDVIRKKDLQSIPFLRRKTSSKE